MTPAAPRLIVEVRGGRAAGTKAVIAPGAALRFGRTDVADVAVPHDNQLSSVHFELSWDGTRCHLRDRNSLQGTTVDGLPVIRTEVPHGGWIRAGQTDFMVFIENHTPPPDAEYTESEGGPEDPEDTPDGPDLADQATLGGRAERRASAEKALTDLRTESTREPLYAILDAARDDRILQLLRESIEPHRSLYEGVEGESLDHVAPYLTGPFRPDSHLLEHLVLEGWGRRWGIYLTSRAPFKEVRRHFRRFLMVELEETGEKVYFRFYDPWFLDAFPSAGREDTPGGEPIVLSGSMSPGRVGYRFTRKILAHHDAALSGRVHEAFLIEIGARMRRLFPEHVATRTRTELLDSLRRESARARKLGISTRGGVRRFLELWLCNEKFASTIPSPEDAPTVDLPEDALLEKLEEDALLFLQRRL